MSILENIVAIFILAIYILPISNTTSTMLRIYKNYQKKEEILLLLEEVSNFFSNANFVVDEIILLYDEITKEYTYKNERFSVIHLNQNRIIFKLEVTNIEKTGLLLMEISFEEFDEKINSIKIIKRKFLLIGD